ncbi:MAG: hypothetical protein JRI96_09940 [Deltaproteobacteria bacterium]|nr:hypothetical protein [Deltaproteobacteria bacterium]
MLNIMYPSHFQEKRGHTESGLINFMKLLAQRYTQYYNGKYGRTGKLWENRYKMHPIDPSVYYVVLKYIEMNPVRAGMVEDAIDYPWSSAAYHLQGKEDRMILADCIHDSAFSYKEFFYEDERMEDLKTIRIATKQGKAWGQEAFLKKLAHMYDRVVVPQTRGRPRKK